MRAETSTPVNEIIATRRSPRSFNEVTEISNDDLVGILEAARWAPSAFNGQPWRFIVGKRGDEQFTQILSSLVEFNQMWASKASALVLVASTTTKSDGTPHDGYLYDCGLAVAQLTIEAHDRGLIVHQMTGFDKEAAHIATGLPGEVVSVAVAAIGYQDAPEKLQERMQKGETAKRERLALHEIVLKGLPS